ncbi:MAG: hypothetical protein C0456_06290 [Hyphomonas sp.]|uniref:hypothetical protein n=1 Tax=Hyphomonas sp. TaxID=87 RepID=UPI001E14EEC1|nr:hypothetical protein [Hyphomonas sp.]MBA4226225.1 hypothetical protein [Hyphomonas sp.]
MSTSTSLGYDAGHPWYYVLGGVPLGPKKILNAVRRRGYRGYLQDEIASADGRCEPRRSQELRSIRQKVASSLRDDLAQYRRAVLHLRRYRKSSDRQSCTDIHTAVSLKHNHLFNDLAHLDWIDELLSVQLDLFEC